MFWQTYLSEYLMDPIQSIVEGEKWSNHSVIASKSNQYWAGISSEYSPSAYIEFTQLAHH
jgi:hypothetical protein